MSASKKRIGWIPDAVVRSPEQEHAEQREAVVTGTLINDFPEKLPPHLARLVNDAPESCDDLRHGLILAAVRGCMADGEGVNVVTIGRRAKEVDRNYIALLMRDTLPIGAAESEAETLCADYEIRRTKTIFTDALASIEAQPDRPRPSATMRGVRLNLSIMKTARPMSA